MSDEPPWVRRALAYCDHLLSARIWVAMMCYALIGGFVGKALFGEQAKRPAPFFIGAFVLLVGLWFTMPQDEEET